MPAHTKRVCKQTSAECKQFVSFASVARLLYYVAAETQGEEMSITEHSLPII